MPSCRPGLNLRKKPSYGRENCGALHYAEDFFITGKSSNPVERTLLTSGLIDFIMRSRKQGHKLIETPELSMAYRGPEQSAVCEGPGS